METEFKDRLKKALSEAGMTAKQLSDATGINEANISNYLKGHYVAKQDKVYLIARVLRVDPGWLMTGYQEDAEESAVPQTVEARSIAKGIDTMPKEQREAILAMMRGLYPKVFKKGNEEDDS